MKEKPRQHKVIKIKGGEVVCACGWSYYERDTGFPYWRLQDRLLDFFLDHVEDMKDLEE